MSKALEILKELDNQDIWVLLELGLEHTNIASAIAELEAQKAKSCEGCQYFNETQICNNLVARSGYKSNTFYCNQHEPKA